MITRTDMELEDNPLRFGLQAKNQAGYEILKHPSRELPYKNKFWNAITFEVSLDQRKYFRRVYALADLLSDLGGLSGALSPLCYAVVLSCQYRGSY